MAYSDENDENKENIEDVDLSPSVENEDHASDDDSFYPNPGVEV